MPVRVKKNWVDTRSALVKTAQAIVREAAFILRDEVKANIGNGSGPGIDSGKLRRSIRVDRSGLKSRTRPTASVGSKLWYAKVQEYGGSLTAKKGYMTIPLNPKAKRLRKKSIRGLGLITVRSKTGNLIMGLKTPKRKEFRPLFLLTKSIRIPARPYFRPAVYRALPKIRAMAQARIRMLGGGK